MKKVKLADIANEAIKNLLVAHKVSSAFIVATDPLKPTSILYYLPWAAEVIDDEGTVILGDNPGFETAKARILSKPLLLKDLIHQFRLLQNKKASVKLLVGETSVSVTKVAVADDGSVTLS